MQITAVLLTLFLAAQDDVAEIEPNPPLDILITGGQILDGTGNPWFKADVGVRNGVIVGIGNLAEEPAIRIVDARGQIVCPGFIDMHTHCDSDLGKEGTNVNLNYLIQGVTSVVTGNCGDSALLDVSNTREDWEKRGLGTHVIYMLGHSSIRHSVMGDEPRAPTGEELEKMQSILRKGMENGAWGLSTGLEYVPGRYADTEEVIALASVASEFGGVYLSHMRDEADDIVSALLETIRVGEEGNLPVCVSHFKVTGKGNWGGMTEAIRTIQEARDRGVEIVADQYPYAQSAPIGLMGSFLRLPRELLEVRTLARKLNRPDLTSGEKEDISQELSSVLERALSDPDVRERIRALTEEGKEHDPSPIAQWGWHDFNVLVSDRHSELVGINFTELDLEEGQTLFDRICELILDEPSMLYGGGSQSTDDVREAIVQSWLMVSSDGGSLPLREIGDSPVRGHPRDSGSQTRVLAKFVREEGVITLEDAVRKMTSLPASFLRLPGRGLVQTGFKADIVIFDPSTVQDNATWDNSREYATGISHVILDGNLAVEGGAWNGSLHGAFLNPTHFENDM